jgi:hypothetical protein
MMEYPSSMGCSNKTPPILSARRHVANLAHGLKTPLATLAIALSETGRDTAGELHSLVMLMERRIRHHLTRARAAALSGPTRARTPVAPRLDDIANAIGKFNADKPIALTQNMPRDLAVACERRISTRWPAICSTTHSNGPAAESKFMPNMMADDRLRL